MDDDGGAADGETEAVLEALLRGDLTVAEAAERLAGVRRVADFARVDARRGRRTGIPEVVDAERKTDDEVVAIAEELLSGPGRAVVAGASASAREALERAAVEAEYSDRSGTLVLHADGYEAPVERGRVGVVTAGTSDVAVAEQAAVLAREMGCVVETAYDVGVSALHRLLAELETLEACDCVVVGAGREGALATVVAGLVPAPVIGLPVGTGSGYGGGGEAALMGMLQSCTPLTVVNVDAGYVAGGQAALIAR